jgi:hypothetical protein
MSFAGYTLQTWAGTYLAEDAVWHRTCEFGEAPEPDECKRADGARALAIERLTNDRAKSHADLSAKVVVIVDQMRCGCTESALDLLGALALDLRMLEAEESLRSRLADSEPDEEAMAPAAI